MAEERGRLEDRPVGWVRSAHEKEDPTKAEAPGIPDYVMQDFGAPEEKDGDGDGDGTRKD